MRTKTLLIAAAALVAGIISSNAQVYSANVVGYVNRVIPANPSSSNPQYAFVCNPLDAGTNTLISVLQGLPVGSKVEMWDYANANFDLVYTRSPVGAGWSPTGSGTNLVLPGVAFFVELPVGNTTGWTNTFVGNVLQGNLTNNMLPGYTAEGFQVPVNSSVTNGWNLNASLPATPSGSELLFYNETSPQGFTGVYTRSPVGAGWSPSVPVFTPAVGFFVLNKGTTNRPWGSVFTVQ